jgi:hypothetical protein
VRKKFKQVISKDAPSVAETHNDHDGVNIIAPHGENAPQGNEANRSNDVQGEGEDMKQHPLVIKRGDEAPMETDALHLDFVFPSTRGSKFNGKKGLQSSEQIPYCCTLRASSMWMLIFCID